MGSVCDFSVSLNCCKFMEFYYASAFSGDEWANHGGQAPKVIYCFFFFLKYMMLPNAFLVSTC